MARRKKRFGLVGHKSKKVANLYWKHYHSGQPQVAKVAHVRVTIERHTRPTNTGRTSGYLAQACVGKVGAGRKIRKLFRKCGTMEFGRTPTAAMKRALVAFGRDRGIK